MKIKEWDSVIFYCDEDSTQLVQIIRNKKTENKKGTFLHNDIIGKEYGSKIYDILARNFIYVLKRTPELIAASLKKKTQILFEHDIAFICLLCNASPNKKIIEAGTGTGCLTYALANAVIPHGKIYTFEYNKERFDKVTSQFQQFGDIVKNIQFCHKDIINTDWGDSIKDVDSVILDMPNPWLCVEKVKNVLKERGVFVVFLPCIEQVHKLVDALEATSFCEIVTYELLHKSWDSGRRKIVKDKKKEQKPTSTGTTDNWYLNGCSGGVSSEPFLLYQLLQKENKTHTGYVTVAKKILDDENDQMETEVFHFTK